MPNLTKQEQKVYDYILNHPGATTRDIINATYVTCPSGRITEMRKKGVPIISVGKKHYDGAHPFEMYAIQQPKKKPEPMALGINYKPGPTAASQPIEI